MTTSNKTHTARGSEQGNAKIITLVILALAAIGGGAYYTGQLTSNDATAASKEEPAAGTETANTAGKNTEKDVTTAAAGAMIKAQEAADPVIAKLGDKEIKRGDLLRFLQQLPPEIKQQPFEKLYPYAQEQLINNELIAQKVDGINMDDDPIYQKQLEQVKKNVARTVYMEELIKKRITDARIKKEYEEYKKTLPKVEEIKAAHILVDNEELAKKLIKELDGGADFAKLAKENSKDSSAARGGELNYFTKKEVVPEFSEAAFKLKKGTYTKTPVKSKFGYHIIKVEDKRIRPPVDFETAKPQIRAQLGPKILQEILKEWKKKTKIEKFDIEGKKIKPADKK